MNIIRRHNLDIFILCQDSLQRVSDIRVLSHGTVCQLRPSRPIGQLTTFILLKKLEVSIRENSCRTKTRWNCPETTEDANNTPQLVKQRGKVKSFDVVYFYCHFWTLHNDDRKNPHTNPLITVLLRNNDSHLWAWGTCVSWLLTTFYTVKK